MMKKSNEKGFYKCPECNDWQETIVEKHFNLRIVKKWNGLFYVEYSRDGEPVVNECVECGTELVYEAYKTGGEEIDDNSKKDDGEGEWDAAKDSEPGIKNSGAGEGLGCMC